MHLTSQVNFQIYVGFDEIKWLCAFTRYVLQKATICVNELIISFSPFVIKHKKNLI